MNLVKSGLPEGSSINEFDNTTISNSNLVFIGEMEFDGLFGYETISTRLNKKFGQESMLSAYAKRKSNLPAPGQLTESLDQAKKFADTFEIKAIEMAGRVPVAPPPAPPAEAPTAGQEAPAAKRRRRRRRHGGGGPQGSRASGGTPPAAE